MNGEIVVILGAGRALLMQIAHPLVAAGVCDHSHFGIDAFTRLWRTIDTVLTVAFGDTEQAMAAADRVTEIHRGVVGTRDGRPYRALDPDLLLWVHATLVDTALVTYERFVAPLTRSERESYYLEMRRFAAAFGVPQEVVPTDLATFDGYLHGTLAGLEVTDEARHLAAEVLAPPVHPAWAPLRVLFREATIGLLPERLRSGFGAAWTPARDRALAAAAWTTRRTLPALPPNVRRWAHARDAVGRSGPKRGGYLGE
ncbi:MAG: oxygenase MpaB family protein [Actinomycetota bacterium]